MARHLLLTLPFNLVQTYLHYEQPLVLATAERVRNRINIKNGGDKPDCYTGFCNCEAITGLTVPFPESVRNTAIYTKADGIVDWRYCINDDPANDFEVRGTHVGLAFNHQVYRLIAERLAFRRNE